MRVVVGVTSIGKERGCIGGEGGVDMEKRVGRYVTDQKRGGQRGRKMEDC